MADLDDAYKEVKQVKQNVTVHMDAVLWINHLSIKFSSKNNISNHIKSPLFENLDE